MQPSATRSQTAFEVSLMKTTKHSGTSFLVYTSAMPSIVKGIRGVDIRSSDIQLDNTIVDILREI